MGVTESIYLASDSAEESFGRSSEPLLFQLPAPPAQTLQIKLLPSVLRSAFASFPPPAQSDVLSTVAGPQTSFLLVLLAFHLLPLPVVALSLLSCTLSGKLCAPSSIVPKTY